MTQPWCTLIGFQWLVRLFCLHYWILVRHRNKQCSSKVQTIHPHVDKPWTITLILIAIDSRSYIAKNAQTSTFTETEQSFFLNNGNLICWRRNNFSCMNSIDSVLLFNDRIIFKFITSCYGMEQNKTAAAAQQISFVTNTNRAAWQMLSGTNTMELHK